MESAGSKVIQAISDYEKLSINQIACAIGYSSAVFYDIQAGRIKGISPKLADRIIDKFPYYNKVWLLTGEGEMLVQKPVLENKNTQITGHHNAVDHSTVQDGTINQELLAMLKEQQRQNAELQSLLKKALEKL